VVVLLALAVIGALAGILIFRAAPRVALVSWTVVLFFAPIWVGFSVSHFYSAIALVTLICIASASTRGLRFSRVDAALLLFAALITGSFLLGGVTLGHLLIALLDWLVPYAFGRVILARIGIEFITVTIAVVTVAAAAFALVEFATHVNIFVLVHWDNSGYIQWSPLQTRGGFLRAEGAFGHSIALGAALAIGSVFILSCRWKLGVRIAALAIVGGATVVTFSRIGLLSFALGMVLSIAFLTGLLTLRARAVIAALSVVGALIALPFLTEVFSAAGQEAQGSAIYRFDLTSLISQMPPLGLSSSYQVLPNGDVYIGNFQSIDSALILIGLRFGYIPLAILLGLLVAALVLMFRSRANAPLIALVAQIPTFATVDLITQLPYLIWFIAGLAVSLHILNNKRVRAEEIVDVRAKILRPERTLHG
jgi:hypothetical protein